MIIFHVGYARGAMLVEINELGEIFRVNNLIFIKSPLKSVT